MTPWPRRLTRPLPRTADASARTALGPRERSAGVKLRPMRWRRLGLAVMTLACVASAHGGGYLADRAFGSTVEPITLGTVRVVAVPALDGRVDVYVPIVDWGVRAAPYEAPVEIDYRFRSLDRDEARGALRSGTAARAKLETIRSELSEVGRNALERAALLGIAGGVAGGLLAGGVIGAALHRRNWLGYGAAAGLLTPLVYGTLIAATLRGVDYEAFERPTFYAQGRELPRLLSLSGQLLTAGESYTRSYEEALAGLANLVAFAGESVAPIGATTSVVVASDLHANTLVLPVLEDYTRDKTVYLPGDFAVLGTELESGIAERIGRLGRRVVAVSGNHDSRALMVELVRAGVTVLTREGREEGGILVDGGTVGAGGPFAIGVQRVGFAEIRFTADGDARAVDLIEVEALSGNAVARRIALRELRRD